MLKIFVADQHSLIRLGLTVLIENMNGLTLAGCGNSGKAALAEAMNNRIDVVVCDIDLFELDGIETCRRIKNFKRTIGVIIYTNCQDDRTILASLDAGVDAYLLKDCSIECLNFAINSVGAGNAFLDPRITTRVLRALKGPEKQIITKYPISPRELEVLTLVEKGMDNAEIAQLLAVSRDTIKTHMRNLMEKLNVKHRNELASKATTLRAS